MHENINTKLLMQLKCCLLHTAGWMDGRIDGGMHRGMLMNGWLDE